MWKTVKNDRIPNCKEANTVYESSCLICNQKDGVKKKDEKESRVVIYLGETSRMLQERTKEHFKDANDFSEGSPLARIS